MARKYNIRSEDGIDLREVSLSSKTYLICTIFLKTLKDLLGLGLHAYTAYFGLAISTYKQQLDVI
jgi:hypothetical protein